LIKLAKGAPMDLVLVENAQARRMDNSSSLGSPIWLVQAA